MKLVNPENNLIPTDKPDTNASVGEKTTTLAKVNGKERQISHSAHPASFFRHLFGSQSKENDIKTRSVSEALTHAKNARLEQGQWLSAISKGGLNQLEINKLSFAIDTINAMKSPAPGPQLIQLKQALSHKRDELLAENGKNDAHQPETDPRKIVRIKKMNSQLVKQLLDAAKADGIMHSLDKKGLLSEFKLRFIEKTNQQPWQTVRSSFTDGNSPMVSEQCPAARLVLSVDGTEKTQALFPALSGGGICSATTDADQHAVNLWTSTFSKGDDCLWAGVRHGTHGAFGIKGQKDREAAAKIRAKQSVLAALTLKPDLIRQWEQNPEKAIPLNLVSVSQLTPTPPWMVKLFGHAIEAKMVKEQIGAFEALAQESPLSFTVKGADGSDKTLNIDLNILCFNFGVNKVAVDHKLSGITGGWKTSDAYNHKALTQLTGDIDNNPEVLGGWINDFLLKQKQLMGQLQQEVQSLRDDADRCRIAGQTDRAEVLGSHADNKQKAYESINRTTSIVSQLGSQVREIFESGKHRKEGVNAYKMSARLLLLTYLINGIPLYNCKSGKDRTGMLDAQVKLLIAQIERSGNCKVPEPDEPLTDSERQLFHHILLNSGNHEIQAINTGRPGYMINATSVRKQVGDPEVWRDVLGSSGAVRS